KSPMVGTAYLQASPEAPPFCKPGDKVKKGQTLLIVEAMKTMNPIQCPRDGVIKDILVGDGQPVEFGEPLVLLEA
ncbi:MAG: acetyl-CoA carboxylase, biotin carboxyl carrier protein, partial [Caulobacterales bacterium]|nr:acetyl-CoA carboxylase, biotin carboxyl carrier protein [Caulobacterales bacterium]